MSRTRFNEADIVEHLKDLGFKKCNENLTKNVWVKYVYFIHGSGTLTIPESRPDIRKLKSLTRQVATPDIRAMPRKSEDPEEELMNPLRKASGSSDHAPDKVRTRVGSKISVACTSTRSKPLETPAKQEKAKPKQALEIAPSLAFNAATGKLTDESLDRCVGHVLATIYSELFVLMELDDNADYLPAEAQASFDLLTAETMEPFSSTVRQIVERNVSLLTTDFLDDVVAYALFNIRRMYLEVLRVLCIGSLPDEVSNSSKEMSKGLIKLRLLKFSSILVRCTDLPANEPTGVMQITRIFKQLEENVFALDTKGYLGESSHDNDCKSKSAAPTSDEPVYEVPKEVAVLIPKEIIPICRDTLKKFLICYLRGLPGQELLRKHLDLLFR